MQPMTVELKNGLVRVGVAGLVVVGLLLFAVLAIAMRPLLIVAGIGAVLVCLILYRFSPSFREWYAAAGEQQIRYNGLHLATDVAMYPNHSWVRWSRTNAIVGADDLVQSVLGPVEAVTLPPVGRRIEQGERLFSLRRGNRSVAVRAPLSGTIVAANEALCERPALVNEDPFERGWAVRLRPDRVQEDGRQLLRGSQARGWFRREIDRLLSTVLGHGSPLPALPDGGTLVATLYREIDDNAWQRLTETFFEPDVGSSATT